MAGTRSRLGENSGVTLLQDVCVEIIAQHLDALTSLQGVPDHLVLRLFEVRRSLRSLRYPLTTGATFRTPPVTLLRRAQLLPPQRVLALGKLTPRVLGVFEAAETELITLRIKALGIRRWTPPLVAASETDRTGRRPLW